MDLDDLKSSWQNAGEQNKSQAELQRMTKVKNHPSLKRIRIKVIIEVALLILFLAVYKDIFDGEAKPYWANLLLIVSAVLFVLNDIATFFSLQNPLSGSSLAQSVKKLSLQLKRLAVSSIASSLLFGLSIILFMSSTIAFTAGKYMLLAGMLLMLLVFTYFSYRNWWNRISHFEKVAEEFEENS